MIELDNPAKFPSARASIERIEEPIIAATIHTPPEYVGALLKLCEERRGTQTSLSYAGERRVIIRYDLPLTEVVYGFYDRMKSVSRGYASLDYEPKGYRDGRPGPAGPAGQRRARRLAVRSSSTGRPPSQGPGTVRQDEGADPQQQFEVAIQAAIGSRIIARTTVKALRKNVTAKCYGGDITPQAQVVGAAEGR